MSSIYKNHICSGEITSCLFCISHVQQAYEVSKLFQTPYWKSEDDYNNSPYYYEKPQVFSPGTTAFTTFKPITSSTLYNIPQCQICQQNSQQTESQLVLSSLLAETSMYSNFGIDDESFITDSIDMVDPSLLCEAELCDEDSMSPSINNQALDCTMTEVSPKIQLVQLDLSSSPLSKTDVLLNPPEIPTSNAPSKYDNQPDVQNVFISSPLEYPLNDSLSLHDEFIPKTEELKKDSSMKCQSSNCSVDGENNTRESKCKLQHVCHVTGCEKVFIYPKALKKHLNWHDRQKKFICAHCDKECSQKHSLSLHIRIHMTGIKRKKCLRPNYRIEDGKKTMGSDGKMQHICDIVGCGRVFVYPRALKKHLEMHDSQKNLRSNRKLRHVCPIIKCEKVFAYFKKLSKHLEVHDDQEQLFCPYCDKEFASQNILKRHVKLHTNAKWNKRENYRLLKSQGSFGMAQRQE